jgi:hypothetical protein
VAIAVIANKKPSRNRQGRQERPVEFEYKLFTDLIPTLKLRLPHVQHITLFAFLGTLRVLGGKNKVSKEIILLGMAICRQ